ncbi:hypothetical protein H4582DRAFT_1903288 [Lactarius indigo]|nr:hypothetical protein H4582DRAFT_1903288 [Lactarius indigo]
MGRKLYIFIILFRREPIANADECTWIFIRVQGTPFYDSARDVEIARALTVPAARALSAARRASKTLVLAVFPTPENGGAQRLPRLIWRRSLGISACWNRPSPTSITQMSQFELGWPTLEC